MFTSLDISPRGVPNSYIKQKTAQRRETHVHRGSSYIVRAENGARTRDLRLGKPTLYQLSYFRIFP